MSVTSCYFAPQLNDVPFRGCPRRRLSSSQGWQRTSLVDRICRPASLPRSYRARNWRPEVGGDPISRLHRVRQLHWQLALGGCSSWSAWPRIRFAIVILFPVRLVPWTRRWSLLACSRVHWQPLSSALFIYTEKRRWSPAPGHRSQWRPVVCLEHEPSMVVTLFYLIDPSTPEAAYVIVFLIESLIHEESLVKLILNYSRL